MKSLVIGGLGFVGSHLSELLVKKGHDVTIFSKSDKKIKNVSEFKDDVKIIFGNLANISKEVVGFDYIFHLAGSTDNYAIVDRDLNRDIDSNCRSTLSLLDSVSEYNPSARVLFSSTFFVNGNTKVLPVTPETPCNPLGIYGATKLAAEHFCKIYNRVKGLDVVIARFTNVFGEREIGGKRKAGFNYLIKQACENKPLKVYNGGDFYRNYIHVEDVASACLKIAEKGETSNIYYVGREKSSKFSELIEIISEKTGVEIQKMEPPEFHKKVGILDFSCDTSPLINLGWQPEVSLEEGIQRTINYYKEG